MNRIFAALVLICAMRLVTPQSASAVTIQWSPVGNPGNAADPATGSLYGAVGYNYNIGTYDVTLSQYTAFLNSVATTDTYGLYNPNLGTDLNVAGIARSGASGSYNYAVMGSGNRPVTYVSWFDAARFTNWLNNGPPIGLQTAATTEAGAYTLNSITSGGSAISKNGNARYWIPSENEWYKAAYYGPNKGGPGVGGYWQYPTQSRSVPGNAEGSGANKANYYTSPAYPYNGVYCVTQSSSYSSMQNYLTDGGAFTDSAGAYGTFDQGGNVFQWNDTVLYGSSRGLQGGAWNYTTSTCSPTSSTSIRRPRTTTLGFVSRLFLSRRPWGFWVWEVC